jgi:hypothetical protein
MPGPVSLETSAPHAVRAARVEKPENDSATGVARETGRAASSPHVQVAVSQILMNAESLIASVMGVKANEVSISVNVGRYEF